MAHRLSVAASFIVAAALLVGPTSALLPAFHTRINGALSLEVPTVCTMPVRRLMATPARSGAPAPQNKLCNFPGSSFCNEAANRLGSPTPIQLEESLVQLAMKNAQQSTTLANKFSKEKHWKGKGFYGSFGAAGGLYSELTASLQNGLVDLKQNNIGKAIRNFMDARNKIGEIIDEYAVNCEVSPLHHANVQLFHIVRNCLGVLYNF